MASLKRFQKACVAKLRQQQRFGQSKHEAKQAARAAYLREHGNLKGYNPSRVPGIYSYKTMETYSQAVRTMASWMHDHGISRTQHVTPELVKEYLQDRQSQNLSAWTLSRDLAAANKAFGYQITKADAGLSMRRMADIKRSREPVRTDGRDFSKNADQMAFSHACGCRRQSVETITADKLVWKDGKVVAVQLHEKGGKDRIAPILNEDKDKLTAIINQRIENAKENGTFDPEMKLFPEKYDIYIDNHAIRAEYAQALIRQLQDERNQGQELCQGDWKPRIELNQDDKTYKGYDRDIAIMVSQALGHERLDVLAHYVR